MGTKVDLLHYLHLTGPSKALASFLSGSGASAYWLHIPYKLCRTEYIPAIPFNWPSSLAAFRVRYAARHPLHYCRNARSRCPLDVAAGSLAQYNDIELDRRIIILPTKLSAQQSHVGFYLARLVTFGLIIFAIIKKNRPRNP